MQDNRENIKTALHSEDPEQISRALNDWLQGVLTDEEYAAEIDQNEPEKAVKDA